MSDPIHTIAQLYPRLMRAMGHLRGAVDETMDLTYNQYKALLTLSDMGPCTLNALSTELEEPGERDPAAHSPGEFARTALEKLSGR